MAIDKKKIELAMEKLTAMEDFAKDLRSFLSEFIESDIKEAPPAAKPSKTEKAKKAVVAPEPEPEVEEEGEDEDLTIDDVKAMSLKELLELAKDNELEIPAKIAKKQDKVLELIIEAFFAEEEEEPEEEDAEEEDEDGGEDLTAEDINKMGITELLELAKENEVEVPKKIAKNVEKVREFLVETFFSEEGEEDAPEEEVEEDSAEDDQVEISQERADAEEKIEKDIKKSYSAKKLTIKNMKDELKKYYDGDENCKDCKGCTNDEILDCYIQLKQNFVSDDGEVNPAKEAYMRDDTAYCCGQECVENPDNEAQVICEICGAKWDME